MSIKLGIAPIAWSNDDMPELGGETTLEQCLSEASIAGFTGIEFGGKFPKNSKELLPKLEKENLQLCSGWYGATLLRNTAKEEFKLMHEQMKLFKKESKLNVNLMPVLLGGLHQMANITAPGLNPSRAKHMIKDLKICADWYKIKFQFNRYFPLKTINIM